MNEYKYARNLAVTIWQKHYKTSAPEWESLDDLMGVLTQIDNMVAGMVPKQFDRPLPDPDLQDPPIPPLGKAYLYLALAIFSLGITLTLIWY